MITVAIEDVRDRRKWLAQSCRIPSALHQPFVGVSYFKSSQVDGWIDAMGLAVISYYAARGLIIDDGSLEAFRQRVPVDLSLLAHPPVPVMGRRVFKPEFPDVIWGALREDAGRKGVSVGSWINQICIKYLIDVGLYPDEYIRYAVGIPARCNKRQPIAA
jgi:hypothetical protein